MESNNYRLFDYTVLSSATASSILTSEDVYVKKSTFIAPFLFSLLTMTVVPPSNVNDISAVSQSVAICQTIDIPEPVSKEEILNKFVSLLVIESKDIDSEIVQIVNKNYKELLW